MLVSFICEINCSNLSPAINLQTQNDSRVGNNCNCHLHFWLRLPAWLRACVRVVIWLTVRFVQIRRQFIQQYCLTQQKERKNIFVSALIEYIQTDWEKSYGKQLVVKNDLLFDDRFSIVSFSIKTKAHKFCGEVWGIEFFLSVCDSLTKRLVRLAISATLKLSLAFMNENSANGSWGMCEKILITFCSFSVLSVIGLGIFLIHWRLHPFINVRFDSAMNSTIRLCFANLVCSRSGKIIYEKSTFQLEET